MSVASETLQPFKPRAKCPKCDAADAAAVWRPGTVRLSKVTGLAKATGEPEPGWMHRTCVRCGYDWAEATLDA